MLEEVAPGSRGPDDPTLAWHVWDGEQTRLLARFTPTPAFARNYMQFADQYDETPRLWSPAGDAIAFGALTAGGSAAAVVRLDDSDGVTSLGSADVSFWRPSDAVVPPAPSPHSQPGNTLLNGAP